MATYYVSTTGSDGNAGTEALPWLTWQFAVDWVSPGDVINVFQGTYTPVRATSAARITTDGTSGAPITIQGYGGRPVLNGSAVTGTGDRSGFSLQADWWIVKDIDVTGTLQFSSGTIGCGVELYGASHNVLERVQSYANEGPGFILGNGGVCTDNLLFNCDGHSNSDPLSAGNNADGFSILYAGTGNVVDSCRAWDNSDDGFDLWETEDPVIIRKSWAWGNSANGFKLGQNQSGPLHQIHNNLAFDNAVHGFTSNGAAGALELFNNTAYNNTTGFGFSFTEDSGANASVLRNNLSGGVNDVYNEPDLTDDSFNSWNLAVTVSAADFYSVDAALAVAPRGAGGVLPVNNLFRLVPTSDLIDKGTNVGLPYTGPAPDLGAFEFVGNDAKLVFRKA